MRRAISESVEWLRTLLLVAALGLTLATSRFQPLAVDVLVQSDGWLYALSTHERAEAAFRTVDGVTWERTVMPVPATADAWTTRTTLDGFALHGRQVRDAAGGAILWQIPNGRGTFMHVLGAEPWHFGDIARLPRSPDVLVMAAGTEGVLVRDGATGAWTRRAVGPIEPTPTELSIGELPRLVLGGQWLFGLTGFALALVLVLGRAWLRERVVTTGGRLAVVMFGPMVPLAVAAWFMIPGMQFGDALLPASLSAVILGLALAAVMAPIASVHRGVVAERPALVGARARAIRAAAVAGIGCELALMAWDLGVLPTLVDVAIAACAMVGVCVAAVRIQPTHGIPAAIAAAQD